MLHRQGGTDATSRTGSRFAYLDSIRGIAALSVIYLHVALSFTGKPLAPIERALFHFATHEIDCGKVGVTLFFGVSGFVIPFSLLSGKRLAARDFVIGRIFRLYPAYWVSIPLGLFFFFVLPGVHISASAIAANFTMLQAFIGVPNIQGLYWTLQIELVFYFLCLAMFLAGILDRLKWVAGAAGAALAAAVLLAVGRHFLHRALPVALPLALFVMFFGMIWRLYILEADAMAGRWARVLLITFFVAFPAMSWFAYGQTGNAGSDDGNGWLVYVATYYLALTLFVVLTSRLRITTRPLPYLGAISYSVYLFGAVVQAALTALVPALADGHLPGHLLIVATMAATIPIAALNYHLVERPMITLGKRLIARLQGSATARISEVV